MIRTFVMCNCFCVSENHVESICWCIFGILLDIKSDNSFFFTRLNCNHLSQLFKFLLIFRIYLHSWENSDGVRCDCLNIVYHFSHHCFNVWKYLSWRGIFVHLTGCTNYFVLLIMGDFLEISAHQFILKCWFCYLIHFSLAIRYLFFYWSEWKGCSRSPVFLSQHFCN